MICVVALAACAALAAFSATYRPLAREALACVFRRVTLRPCTTGFDRRVRAAVAGRLMRRHPRAARLAHRHLEAVAWAFVLVLLASSGSLAYALSNFYRYGSCYGPVRRGFCIFDPSGRRSRYSGIATGYRGTPVLPDEGGVPALGAPDAPVTVIEFGSYTCPYTRLDAPVVDDLLARHGSRVRFVYRHFPLDAVESVGGACEAGAGPHAGAARAAVAATCARDQGRFWEFHRALLARPDALTTCDGLVALADELGLDRAGFARCLEDPAKEDQVQRDFEDGVKAGLYGTPTFFVAGTRLVAPSPADLGDAIQGALARAGR